MPSPAAPSWPWLSGPTTSITRTRNSWTRECRRFSRRTTRATTTETRSCEIPTEISSRLSRSGREPFLGAVDAPVAVSDDRVERHRRLFQGLAGVFGLHNPAVADVDRHVVAAVVEDEV